MDEYYNELIGGTINFTIDGVDMQDYIREYYREEVFKYADIYTEKYYDSSRSTEKRFREVIIRNYMGLRKQTLKKDNVYKEKVLKGYYRSLKLNEIGI